MDNPDNAPRSLLDPEQIKMLLESGADESIDLFNEILGLFEEESEHKFDEMRSASLTGDYEAFSRAAHALSGSSANIGGREVWLKAREMENLCKSGKGEQAVSLLADLEEMHRETLIQMRQFVHQMTTEEA